MPLMDIYDTNSLIDNYTADELTLINLDLENIWDEQVYKYNSVAHGKKEYVGSAGGPGAGKSTLLENEELIEDGKFIYVDPDRASLLHMQNTYLKSIEGKETDNETRKVAYEKWRDASKHIADTIAKRAFDLGYSIAHGTTGSSVKMGEIYKALDEDDYNISLYLCSCSIDTAVSAVQRRINTSHFFQAAAEDVRTKQDTWPLNFPYFFEYGTTIKFCWNEGDYDEEVGKNGSQIVATLDNNSDELTVLDQHGFDKFVARYNSARKEGPTIQSFVESYLEKTNIDRQISHLSTQALSMV